MNFKPLLCMFFILSSFSHVSLAEKIAVDASGDIILGHLYVGSVSVRAEEFKASGSESRKSRDSNISGSMVKDIEVFTTTVSGTSLVACQAALQEVLNKNTNIVSHLDCAIKP